MCTIPAATALATAITLAAAVTLVAAATLAATTATPPTAATPPSPLPLLLSTATTVAIVGSGSLCHACGRHHHSAAAGADHIVAVASLGSGPSSTSRHHHCCHCCGRDRFVGVAKLLPFVAAVMLEVVVVVVVATQLPQSPLDGAGAHTTATALSHRAWIVPPRWWWWQLGVHIRQWGPAVALVMVVVMTVLCQGGQQKKQRSVGRRHWGAMVMGCAAMAAAGRPGIDINLFLSPILSVELPQLTTPCLGTQTTPPPAAGKQVTTMPLPPSPHLPLYYSCNHDGHEHTAGSELGLSPVNQGKATLLYCCSIAHISLQPPFIPSPHASPPLPPPPCCNWCDKLNLPTTQALGAHHDTIPSQMQAPAIPQDHATFVPPPYMFLFFTFDGSTKPSKFTLGSFPGSMFEGLNIVDFLSEPTARCFIWSLQPVCETIFNLLLLAYIASLKAYCNRGTSQQKSLDGWVLDKAPTI
ncbi:hypothetical protein EDB83DRAFT_2316689 [Lactarius deliciosus]|nr:hypothetical protein EDB83DRAFT_2316689 [Lactarius deliciosus]